MSDIIFLPQIIDSSIIDKEACFKGDVKVRKPYERDIQKEILGKCFEYLVQKGLEHASVKNLCEETGISSGSIYYWFKDRN